MKKFILGLIVGLLLPAVGGYLYLKMGMMPVATASAPLPMEEKIAKMALQARMQQGPDQGFACRRRRDQYDAGRARLR